LELCQHALANHLLLPRQTKNKNKDWALYLLSFSLESSVYKGTWKQPRISNHSCRGQLEYLNASVELNNLGDSNACLAEH
jgi:hypothetical protein